MPGSDRQRDVVVKVRVNKEGQLTVFRDIAEEIGELGPAADEAERAVDRLGASVENNFRGSYRATTDAGFALEQYRQQIEAVQAAGGAVTPEQLQQLEQLERRYDSLIGSVGEYRAAQQQVGDEIKDATAAAGGYGDQIRNVDDLIEQLAGTLGSGAAKWAAWGTAAVGAFTAGWQAGQKLRGVLNEITDGQFDRNVQESFRGIAEAIVGTADEASLLQNQMNVLAKNGIDVAGKSAEEVDQIYREFTAGLRDNAVAVMEAEAAYQAWREGLGPTAADLDKLAASLAKNIEKLQETESELSESEFAALVKPQVDALVAEYERLGVEPPPHIQALIEEMDRLAQATAASTDTMASETEEKKAAILQAMSELREGLRPIPEALAEEAEAVGISVGAWERHNEVITITPEKAKEAGEAAKEAGEAAGEGAEGLGEQAEAAEDAAGKTSDLATAAGDAAGKTKDLGTGAKDAATGVGELKTSVDGVGTKIKDEFSGADGFEEPIVQGVGRIKAEIEGALASLRALKAEAEA